MNGNKIIFKRYNPFTQSNLVKDIWVSMLRKCPHSYFLSWGWVETWIKIMPHDTNLSLIVGFRNESPVIAFFVGSKTSPYYKISQYRKLILNQTFNPNIDLATYVEYNAILIDPYITISLETLLKLMPIKSWDEFIMIRCSSIYQPNLIIDYTVKKTNKINLSVIKPRSYYVSLDKIRQNNDSYLTLLSKNKRKQIRRSIKEYETIGEIRIVVAENIQDALKIFDNLVQLHQKSWNERGHTGAFSNHYMVDFHKNLITRRFENREIQLIKVTAGNYTIGCLYNFVYDGKVYAFSAGFNYLPGRAYRPGFVCDHFAVIHNAKIGMSCYDFMEGEDEYKKSLSTDYNEMDTIHVRNRNSKYMVERIIARLSQIYERYMGLKL